MKSSLEKSVLEIVLDDLKTNNAFDLKKAKTLNKFLSLNNVSLIIIRSEGRVFCSGGNLKEYAKMKTKDEGLKANKQIRAVLTKLYKHPALKVAYVSGDCFGGGIELLSAFDLIYTEPHVFFGMWQKKMSLSFGWGGFERLSKKMSQAVLMEWILMGSLKTAFRVHQEGLVNKIMSLAQLKVHREHLIALCQNDKDGTFKSIAKNLKKDEVKVFESLWGSGAHLEKLKKFSL